MAQNPTHLSKPPITFPKQASAFARKTPLVPFHGRTIGFVVNFTPHHAVRFDLATNPVEVLTEAYSPGQVQIEIMAAICACLIAITLVQMVQSSS